MLDGEEPDLPLVTPRQLRFWSCLWRAWAWACRNALFLVFWTLLGTIALGVASEWLCFAWTATG